MIFSGRIKFDGNHGGACLVGGKDKKEAMKKINRLYESYQIDSIEIMEISSDTLSKLETFYVGGLVLAEFEDYGD